MARHQSRLLLPGEKEGRRGFLKKGLLGGALLVGGGTWLAFRSTKRAEELDERLRAWRDSRLSVRRTGFKALRGLCCAAYYSSIETYPSVGYPGPPELTAPIEQSTDEWRK